jgi:aspartyl-tRNA(Asn)/glutamyl-tRNA(Gln) amidotransferase subunit A
MNAQSADPRHLTVHQLSAAIQGRRLSPVELVDTLLDAIARVDEKLHAFVALYSDDARLAAEAADKAIRAGHSAGPLHGVPIALKDLVEIEGHVTTGGSKVWQHRVSHTTATVVVRAKAAGMIVIGKTQLVEFAFGGWGTNEYLGTPWNPWNAQTALTPGGSSSGSGVAVAGRLVPCAIGSDTGGSVRLPASWCGIVGFKPTVGRISTHGVLPLAPTLDTLGPMTRSVEDAAMLYDLFQDSDPLDPRSSYRPADGPMATLRRGVHGLRLAVLPQPERSGVDQDVLAAYDASIEVLRGLGAQVRHVELPCKFSDFAAFTGQIIGAEAYSILAEIVDRPDLPVDPDVKVRILGGKPLSARDYLLALSGREKLKRQFARAFAEIDALLTPTTMTPAIPVAEVDQSSTPAQFTRMVNLLDLCALSLPNGFNANGLPTSLQIICKAHEEALALRIGWAYEQATDWLGRIPSGI